MWCNRGGEEVRWGCPARGHGAVATQTRGCSQCLYQRLPKSYGNIRVNAAGRAVTIRQRRVSRSRRCSYARNRGIILETRAARRTSPRVRERKEGPGTALGGGFPWGFPREDPECRRKERFEEGEKKRKTNDGEIAGSAEERRWQREEDGTEAGFLREILSTKIAIPRRASRHCRFARSTWGRKVRESTRMERARRNRKREREKGRETGSLRGCEKDGGNVPTRLTTTRKERRRAPL